MRATRAYTHPRIDTRYSRPVLLWAGLTVNRCIACIPRDGISLVTSSTVRGSPSQPTRLVQVRGVESSEAGNCPFVTRDGVCRTFSGITLLHSPDPN